MKNREIFSIDLGHYVVLGAQLLFSSTGQCNQHNEHLDCQLVCHLYLVLTCGS